MYTECSNSIVNFVIDQFEMFDHSQCQHLKSIVFESSQFWLQREKRIDFYTLGAAHYLDLELHSSIDYYVDSARKWNPILWDCLEPFYKHLIDRLGQRFGCDFRFYPDVALPGFHIFGPKPNQNSSLFNAFFFKSGGSIHRHPTPSRFAEILGISRQCLPENLYSHTIPICLPCEGSGLNVWPDGMSSIDHPPTYVPYQKGMAYGFEGELVHQIPPHRAASGSVAHNSHRITLQCHDIDLGDYRVLFF